MHCPFHPPFLDRGRPRPHREAITGLAGDGARLRG